MHVSFFSVYSDQNIAFIYVRKRDENRGERSDNKGERTKEIDRSVMDITGIKERDRLVMDITRTKDIRGKDIIGDILPRIPFNTPTHEIKMCYIHIF